jgi:uncharacterized protein YciI
MPQPRQWYLLLHTPGPAVADAQSVFDHPGIEQHYAFLERRAADGTLIAAGPLADRRGEGMTILAASSMEQARRLAEEDDQSVVAGVLRVTLRPWQVVLAPGLPSDEADLERH